MKLGLVLSASAGQVLTSGMAFAFLGVWFPFANFNFGG